MILPNSKQFLFHYSSFCRFRFLVGGLCTTAQNAEWVSPFKWKHLWQEQCEWRMAPERPSEMGKGKRCRRQSPLAWLWIDLPLAVVRAERMCWLVKTKTKGQTALPPRPAPSTHTPSFPLLNLAHRDRCTFCCFPWKQSYLLFSLKMLLFTPSLLL